MFYIHADILFDWIWHVLLGGSSKLMGASGEGHFHRFEFLYCQTVAFCACFCFITIDLPVNYFIMRV